VTKPAGSCGDVSLRPVSAADVDVFYRQQNDPVANEMAGFPARDEEAHAAHWAKILADPTVAARTVVADGAVVGNIVSFEIAGQREVGYWIGRQHWGQGCATRAVALFLDVDWIRPLYGVALSHNAASIRVLEKCGFVPAPPGAVTGDVSDVDAGDDAEVVLVLPA